MIVQIDTPNYRNYVVTIPADTIPNYFIYNVFYLLNCDTLPTLIRI